MVAPTPMIAEVITCVVEMGAWNSTEADVITCVVEIGAWKTYDVTYMIDAAGGLRREALRRVQLDDLPAQRPHDPPAARVRAQRQHRRAARS